MLRADGGRHHTAGVARHPGTINDLLEGKLENDPITDHLAASALESIGSIHPRFGLPEDRVYRGCKCGHERLGQFVELQSSGKQPTPAHIR